MSGEICPQCGEPALHGIEPACRACGHPETDLAPNVRYAQSQRAALLRLHEDARARAVKVGRDDTFARLCSMGDATRAVINLRPGAAFALVEREDALYAPYRRLVNAGARASASFQNDRHRTRVDDSLYGVWGEDMVHATLTADGRGLTSYGSVQLELRDCTIAHRATVLERNSFDAEVRYGSDLPLGRLAVWSDRGCLVGVKLADAVSGSEEPTSDATLAGLILQTTGDRATDEFFEVHIYKGFNLAALRLIRLPVGLADESDRLLIEAIRKSLPASIILEEYDPSTVVSDGDPPSLAQG